MEQELNNRLREGNNIPGSKIGTAGLKTVKKVATTVPPEEVVIVGLEGLAPIAEMRVGPTLEAE